MSQDPMTRVVRREMCTEADIRRVAVMLEMSPEPVLATGVLPRGWQFLLIRADATSQVARRDGFLGLGIALPESHASRVVLAGREVRFLGAIPIGTIVERISEITNISHKDTDGGPLTFVTISHQIRHADSIEILLEEQQTYILMDHRYSEAQGQKKIDLIDSSHSTSITPTDLLLFQYSALCFNPHRIHYDRLYSMMAEGYPDLVVNGGLIALFVTEYLRKTLGVEPHELRARHRLPLFSGRPLTIAVREQSKDLSIQILNEVRHQAAAIEVSI